MTLNQLEPQAPATAILLAFRQADTITAAIDSLLAQTQAVAEIIISDDASDDGTFEIAQRHLQTLASSLSDRIILRRNPENLGLIRHLDVLVRLARYELVVIFAGDDVSLPDRVEKTLAAWRQLGCPSGCLIYGNVETLDENPARVLRPPAATLEFSLEQAAFASSLHIGATESFTRDLWLDWPRITGQGVFEDLALGFRAALRGHYVYLDEVLVRYRLHGGLGDPSKRQPSAQRLDSIANLLRQRLQDLEYFVGAFPNERSPASLTTLQATLTKTLAEPVFNPQATDVPSAVRQTAAAALTGTAFLSHSPADRISVVIPLLPAQEDWLTLLTPILRQQSFLNVEWIIACNSDLDMEAEKLRQALPGEVRLFSFRRCLNEVGLLEAGLRFAKGEWVLPMSPGWIPSQDALRTLLAHAQVTQSDWVTSRPSLIFGGVFAQDIPPDGDPGGAGPQLGLTLYLRKLIGWRPRWWTCSIIDQYLAHWHSNLGASPNHRHVFLNTRLAVRIAGTAPSAGMLHDLLLPYARRTVPRVDGAKIDDPLAEPPDYLEWLAEDYLARDTREMAIGRQRWAVVLDSREASDIEFARSLASLGRQQGSHLRIFVLDGNSRMPFPDLQPGQVSLCRDQAELDAAIEGLATETSPLWWLFLHAGDLLTPDALTRLEQCLAVPEREAVQLIYFDHDERGSDGSLGAPHFKPAPNPALLRSTFYPGRALAVRNDWLLGLGLRPGPLPQHLLYRLCLRTFETEADYLAAHCPGILAHLNHRFPAVLATDDEAWKALAEELRAHSDRLGMDAQIMPGPAPGTFHFIPPLHRTPRISIIIPTKEQMPLLQRCLESLLQNTDYPDFEIIVVDNGSTSPACVNFLQGLEKLVPERLRVVYAPGPFNFSRLNNLAARQASGEFLLLLNNDTAALKPDWLAHMVRHALCDDTAAVGARLVFPDGTLQHAGIVIGLRGTADHPFLGDPVAQPGYLFRAQLTQNYSAVTAACLLVSKSLYEAAGGLDEDIFAVSFNDVDFCLRLTATGKRIAWTPLATLLHEGSASQKAQVEAADFSMKHLRFTREQRAFLARWPAAVVDDPAYNGHLSLASKGFEIETNLHAIRRAPAPASRSRIVGFPADRHGCGHYRVLQPLQGLIESGLAEGGVSHEYLPAHLVQRGSIDTLVLQRPYTDHQLDILAAYPTLDRTLKVYEVDDLLDQIPASSAHHVALPRDMRQRMRQAMSLCDRVVLSTAALAEELAGLNQDMRVVPNSLPPKLWGRTPPRRTEADAERQSRPRIGWAGGIGHLGDLLLIEDVIRTLADEVDWEFFGMCPEPLRPYVRYYVPGIPTEFYPAQLMTLAKNWDLAIAPLQDNRFNLCKSNLRLLEYGWCGVPVVCSDLLPYRGHLPVTRVANRSQAWIDAIRAHIRDRQASQAAGLALQQHVLAHHTLAGDNLRAWLAAWRP